MQRGCAGGLCSLATPAPTAQEGHKSDFAQVLVLVLLWILSIYSNMRTIASLLLAAAATCTLALQGTLRPEWDRAGRSHPLSAVEFSVSMSQSNLDVLEDRFWKISTPGS